MSERVELELILEGGAKAVKTMGELEKALSDAREEIKGVEKGSEDFKRLATAIQDASSEVKTLEKQMEGLEPQQKAEAFLKMGEGIAGGFAVAQGALALAGVESEELEKIQVKVQAAISIAMGVRMMSEAALMATTAKRVVAEKLALVQTKLGTALAYGQSVALGVWATAQGVLTGAVSATTAGMKLLRLAIAATGIGALVLAIIAIGKAVYDWSTATDGVADAQANLNEKLINQNKQFLKNREIQKQLAAAETENEKKLVRTTNTLNEYIEALNENDKQLEENAEKLRNLGDFRKKEQEKILRTAKHLELQNKKYRDGITHLDEVIDKTKEKIAIDEKAAQDEKKRDDDRNRRRDERKARRIQEAEQLRTLEQEIELIRIEDDNKREAAKIEQDRKNALEKVANAENSREQTLLINEKYDKLELERIERQNKKRIDAEQALQDRFNDIMAQIQAFKDKIAADKKKKEIDDARIVEETKANMTQQGFQIAKDLGFKNKKIQKGIAVSETIFNTQASIVRALKDIPAPFGVAQAVVHGAMGAVAIRNILSENMGNVSTGGGAGGGGTDITEPMLPSSTGAFTLGGAQEQPAVKAFVVESEITDSQAQMADINRRSTI